MNNIRCPHCKGEKQIYRHCFPTYLSGWMPCKTCSAAGSITEEKKAILEIGEDIRVKRLALMLAPSDVSQANPVFSAEEWKRIETGDCEIIDSYRARSIIEAFSASFADKFDVYENGAFGARRKIITLDSRSDAEVALKDCRELAKNSGQILVYEIVERKERVLEAN